MPELVQGFLIGVVLAVAAGALMIYLHRVNSPAPPRDEPPDTPRTTPEERPR